MSKLEIAKATMQGDRKVNQDRYIFIESEGSILLALADGMGGHPKGDVAAQILTDTSKSFFYRSPKPIHSPKEFLHRLLQKAYDLFNASQTGSYFCLVAPVLCPYAATFVPGTGSLGTFGTRARGYAGFGQTTLTSRTSFSSRAACATAMIRRTATDAAGRRLSRSQCTPAGSAGAATIMRVSAMTPGRARPPFNIIGQIIS